MLTCVPKRRKLARKVAFVVPVPLLHGRNRLHTPRGNRISHEAIEIHLKPALWQRSKAVDSSNGAETAALWVRISCVRESMRWSLAEGGGGGDVVQPGEHIVVRLPPFVLVAAAQRLDGLCDRSVACRFTAQLRICVPQPPKV